ncbi:MAG: FAD-dependent oxidoreductase [Candidatus Didemnitutus sp.]|nr:FAD-dependent oxidoreductase [Candidatus Didemnitutus sp.]
MRAEGRLTEEQVYPRAGDAAEFAQHLDHPCGYASSPGATADFGDPSAPWELEALIKAGFAQPDLSMHELNQQATMLTVSGGMDRIPHAFAERLDGLIQYGAEVREVRRTADGGVSISGGGAGGPGRMRPTTASAQCLLICLRRGTQIFRRDAR